MTSANYPIKEDRCDVKLRYIQFNGPSQFILEVLIILITTTQ